jgi:cytochrome c-type biogenesis protein CcmH
MNLFPWRRTLRRSAPCARTPFAARSRKTHRAQGALLRALLIVLALAFAASATAQAIDPLPFKDHAQELRFQHLTAQLRCMVCQNETLADSNASLARDMRHEVFRLMQQGKTDAQIKQYLVDRYSDFVLYDPPVQPSTWLLWFGPLLVLLAGAAVVVVNVRKRSRANARAALESAGAAGDGRADIGPDHTGPDNIGDDW